LNSRCWFSALGNLDLSKGLDDCDLALRRVSRDAAILNSRAFVLLRMAQFDKSLSDFNAALKLDPKDASSLYGRGIVESHKGLTSASQADMTAAAALKSDVVDFGRHYGFEP
jgi:hypothetical protein